MGLHIRSVIITIILYTLILIPIGLFVITNFKPELARKSCTKMQDTCLDIVDFFDSTDQTQYSNRSRGYSEPSAFE